MIKALTILVFLAALAVVSKLEADTPTANYETAREQHHRLVENNQRFAKALAACLNGGTLIESGRVIECRPKK